MDFLKRNWSTLIIIGALAAYFGLSLGTDRCPMCVVSSAITGGTASDNLDTAKAKIVGEQPSPDWVATSISGKEFSSDLSKGKVALLVYWATWCAPCIEEIPSLIALREDFADQEVDIIGISLDQPGKDIDSFVASRKINYDIARNNESLDRAFGPVRYIPTILVLDKDGRVQQRYTGLVGEDVIRGKIESLLNQNT